MEEQIMFLHFFIILYFPWLSFTIINMKVPIFVAVRSYLINFIQQIFKIFEKNFIWQAIISFDYFNLGNSFIVYYIFIFCALPIALMINIPSKYINYFLTQNIRIFNFKVFLYLTIGAIFFILGNKFYNFRKSNKATGKIHNFFNYYPDFNRILTAFIFIFSFSFIDKAIRIFNGGYFHLSVNSIFLKSEFYSLFGLLDWFGPLALALAFSYYFRLLIVGDDRYKIWQIIAWADFVFEFIYGFLSESRYKAIIPIIIYLIIRHYVYKKSFLRILVAGCLIFIVLMPIMNFYRNKASFYHGYLGDRKDNAYATEQFIFDSSFGRINQSHVIYNVFEKTGEFSYGKSFSNFFISLGPPRFLWKNKPVINAGGNDFGRNYGILNSDDNNTSVGTTLVGDLFMNFGLFGIIAGMFFFGILFGFIYNFFISGNNNVFGLAIYSVLWIQIIKGMEDWIAPVYAGLVKLVIIFLIINYFLIKRKVKN